MAKSYTHYQNSIRSLTGKPVSFLGEHSINHYDSEHHSALKNEYQNSVSGLDKHPLSYRSAHPLIHDDFTRAFVLKTEAYLGAISDLTKKEMAEASAYIHHDIDELKKDLHESVENFKLTAWYKAWDKVTWGTIASITDKTQVEWTEVGDDIQHEGRYFVGDEVGFGVLQCVRCGYKKELFHPTKIMSCANCDGEEFTRESFEP